MLVVSAGDPPAYAFDPTQPESRAARLAVDAALQRAAGRADAFVPRAPCEVTEPGSRYIDFLVPGLLGMNLMGTGMWGVGFSLVVARNGKLLKRLVATPMRRSHLLARSSLSRLIFLVPEAGALLLFACFAARACRARVARRARRACRCSARSPSPASACSTAARPRTIEGVSGLMNLVMLPMWVFSGIFFSTERFPAAMQPFVQALPLTALNDALRAVMLDGAALASTAPQLLNLTAWGALSFVIALRIFRWQ